jgi:hypothetical protein
MALARINLAYQWWRLIGGASSINNVGASAHQCVSVINHLLA